MRKIKLQVKQYKWLILGVAALLAPVSAHAIVDIHTCGIVHDPSDPDHVDCPAPGYNPTPTGYAAVSLIAPPPSAIPPPYYGAKSNYGAAPTPIDAWGYCRYIDNNDIAHKSYFVPFDTQTEWTQFIAYTYGPSSSITLNTCSRPVDETLFPNPSPADPNVQTTDVGNCDSPSALSQVVHLSYARTSSTSVTASVNFTCTVKGLCNTDGFCSADQIGITRTVTGTYVPGISNDPNQPPTSGWAWTNVDYSILTPNPAPAIITTSCCTTGGDGGGGDGGGGDGGGGDGGGGDGGGGL